MDIHATIAVFGRFHAFNLGQQLQKQRLLKSLISTYPKQEVIKHGIDASCIHSLWRLEIAARIWRRFSTLTKNHLNFQYWFHQQFDQAARNYIIADSNLFIGWSSLCLYSLRRAKKFGALTVVDRGSSHMRYQTQILQEEYERWGLQFNATHPGVYARELQEYLEADRIAVPSSFVKQTFLKEGIPETKIIQVPYGASLSEFYPVPKQDSTFRVIYCGNLTLRKGLPYLLQAFYELNLPDAELWLVGTLTSEITPFLAKYQSDRIILKGKQPQNQLRWFYAQCTVFCLASIEEGLAMVQPQAMACGLPVIHTTNTGGADIVRHGVDGFCVPIRDVEALKEKILFFYENPDRCAEMGKNALAQARQSLSWDTYGEKMIAAYRSALTTKSG